MNNEAETENLKTWNELARRLKAALDSYLTGLSYQMVYKRMPKELDESWLRLAATLAKNEVDAIDSSKHSRSETQDRKSGGKPN